MAAAFGIGVAIESNAAHLAGVMRTLVADQVPFAATVALTRLAQDVKVAEADNLPRRLNTHGNRLQRGLRVVRAEKRDWPNPKAIVGSLDEFLVLQETGGEKKPTKGASHVAIPARHVEARRRPSTGAFAQRDKPRGIPKSRKVHGVGIRAPVKGQIGPHLPGQEDKVWWFLRRSATIRPRLHFRETAETTSKAKYRGHFERELAAALKSARVRSGRFSSEQARFFYRKALASL